MILSAIVAMSTNRVIGKDGTLPWHIPEDFKFFKDMTMGHAMIMGRKTFDSLPGVLKNRLHVIVTRQRDWKPKVIDPNVHIFHDLATAVDFCRRQTSKWGDEVFIIGGGDIFREMLNKTDRIYLTEIHAVFEGDAYFPEFGSEFVEVDRRPRTEPIAFDFVTYERRSAAT
jgi:dihydrofolate reductase